MRQLRLDGEMDPRHTELINVDNPQFATSAASRSNTMAAALTTAIASDRWNEGIRANALCPDFANAQLNEAHHTALWGREALEVGLPDFRPTGRAFLLSDRSTAISAGAFVVDGGALAGASREAAGTRFDVR
jgi:NAD(P)-dependent dehydrogenase (short-subunit alcohol dehydrogenase family)